MLQQPIRILLAMALRYVFFIELFLLYKYKNNYFVIFSVGAFLGTDRYALQVKRCKVKRQCLRTDYIIYSGYAQH